MKLIDKDVLVAEINMHLEYANTGVLYAQSGIEKGLKEYESDLNAWQHCQSMCKNILSFLNTLEVKEVDLEKEFYDFLDTLIGKDNGHLSEDELFRIAEYFFELGLKAEKGE